MDNYNSLRNSLAAANVGYKPPPVIDDQINYSEEALKGGVEGIGSQLTGGAILSSLKGLRKSKGKVLENAGIANNDLDDIEESAANGDLTGAVASASKAILGGLNRQLGNAGNFVKGALRDLGSKARGGQSALSGAKVDIFPDSEEAFRKATQSVIPEGTTDPFSFDATAISNLRGGLRGDQTLARVVGQRPTGEAQIRNAPKPVDGDIQPAQGSNNVPNVAANAEKLGGETLDNTAEIVGKGEKILGDLKKVDAGLTATDFDPVDIAGQAIIGLTTIGLGLLIHPHHVTNVAPKAVQPTNYSAQLY